LCVKRKGRGGAPDIEMKKRNPRNFEEVTDALRKQEKD
jgi:hypothetical protein